MPASSNGSCWTGSVGCRSREARRFYLRLSTKPVEQGAFAAAVDRDGEDAVRRGSRCRRALGSGEAADADDRVILATCGAMVPETLAGRRDPCRRGRRRGNRPLPLVAQPAVPGLEHPRPLRFVGPAAEGVSHLERLVRPDERGLPVVTVIDGGVTMPSRSSAPRSTHVAYRWAWTGLGRRALSPSSTPSTASRLPGS